MHYVPESARKDFASPAFDPPCESERFDFSRPDEHAEISRLEIAREEKAALLSQLRERNMKTKQEIDNAKTCLLDLSETKATLSRQLAYVRRNILEMQREANRLSREKLVHEQLMIRGREDFFEVADEFTEAWSRQLSLRREVRLAKKRHVIK